MEEHDLEPDEVKNIKNSVQNMKGWAKKMDKK